MPIDYDDPTAGTTTIALKKRPAAGDKQGSLFLNPGGPGGSGLDFMVGFSWLAPVALGDAYDFIGFDPRGVGASDPLGCLDTAGLDELLATDVDPDDPSSVEHYASLVEAQGTACLQTNPQLAQHVTTFETAKDLDVLRSLVGDEHLSYYGASYGTFLGATYAALFPERVGRLVLDGAMDPSLSSAQADLLATRGFQLTFDDYLADCLSSEYPLGSSMDEVEQRVADLLDAMADEPLETGDPDRPLTQRNAFYGIVEPLYQPDAWHDWTEALVAAFTGDGSKLLASADSYNNRTADGYAPNQQQANTAIDCLDAPLAPAPGPRPARRTSSPHRASLARSPMATRRSAARAGPSSRPPRRPTTLPRARHPSLSSAPRRTRRLRSRAPRSSPMSSSPACSSSVTDRAIPPSSRATTASTRPSPATS